MKPLTALALIVVSAVAGTALAFVLSPSQRCECGRCQWWRELGAVNLYPQPPAEA